MGEQQGLIAVGWFVHTSLLQVSHRAGYTCAIQPANHQSTTQIRKKTPLLFLLLFLLPQMASIVWFCATAATPVGDNKRNEVTDECRSLSEGSLHHQILERMSHKR